MSAFALAADGPPPYEKLRVLEIGDDPATEYTGRLLAEMGATVVKIEPETGAASRRVGPFAGHEPDPESSLHFWFYNADKRSVRLDLSSTRGKNRFERMLEEADVLLSGLQPRQLEAAGLSLPGLLERFPRLIVAAVTPFGLTGPWKDYKTSDLVALAAGGPLHTCGYDDHSIPPIRPGGNQGYHTGAAFAQMAIALALLERVRTGKGQIVDVSNHEALAVTVELANPYWFYPRSLVYRQTCRHAQPVPTAQPLFQCADGYVYFALVVTEERPWQLLVEWLGRHDMLSGLDDPAYLDAGYRQANFAQIQSIVEVFFLVNDAETMYREGQELGLPIGKLNAPEDVFNDAHLRTRGFFVEVDHGDHGAVEYPGPAYTFSGFKAVAPKPAPRLGEGDKDKSLGATA